MDYVQSGAPTYRIVDEQNIRWALRANYREYALCALSAKSVDAATALTFVQYSELPKMMAPSVNMHMRCRDMEEPPPNAQLYHRVN